MAEELENNSTKKRRIIHWNPDAGREQVTRRWTWKRIVAWTVGGFFGLLIAAGLVIRGVKLVFGPDVFSPHAAVAEKETLADASSAFISQAKADQAYELTSKALAELKKLPQSHPVQLQQLIVMEKNFLDGQAELQRRDYRQAFATFEALNRDIDAYSQNVKVMGEAKQGYDKILIRIRDLELARSLAPGALEAAFEAAGAGRQLLNDGNFSGAKRIFDQGEAELKKAEQVLAEYVRQNLLEGQKALSKGEKAEARKAFEAALEKSPGNEMAVQGMKRAETIDEVYAFLQQGANLEKEGQYQQAAEAYQKAFALDKFSAAAQEGQSRAARLEKETKFAAAKTAAEAAAKARDWTKAIAEFEKALKVYPQKTDVQAALKSAKENAHKDAVQKSLEKGYAFENEHKWNEAREAYEQTLELEPDQAEAKDGFIRVGAVIRALMQYEKLIESAEQMANKAEFQAARQRFNEAMNYKPTYLQPSERVLQLQALLQQQSQPVDVTLKSDGKTHVWITAFRNLGQIDSVTLKIMPGDYEIVGRRKGYREVLMLLQVRNGMPPPTITVACNVSDSRS